MTDVDQAREYAAHSLITLICSLIEKGSRPETAAAARPVVDSLAQYANLAAVHEPHTDVSEANVDHGA